MSRLEFVRNPILIIVIAVASILAAILIGIAVGKRINVERGGEVGAQIGLLISAVAWTRFFRIRSRRTMCQNCKIIFRKAPPSFHLSFAYSLLRTASVVQEGVGGECVKCGRILCHRCYSNIRKCRCKSNQFQNVHLMYP